MLDHSSPHLDQEKLPQCEGPLARAQRPGSLLCCHSQDDHRRQAEDAAGSAAGHRENCQVLALAVVGLAIHDVDHFPGSAGCVQDAANLSRYIIVSPPRDQKCQPCHDRRNRFGIGETLVIAKLESMSDGLMWSAATKDSGGSSRSPACAAGSAASYPD